MPTETSAVVAAHRAAGTFFEVGGLTTFRRDEGEGEAVVLMHGLPASSFLYRKVIPRLAADGLRALSFDLPGLGLADRPEDFDYTIRGLGAFASAAVDALGLERFHLVVHDAGGPVGFVLASLAPGRIRSLTVLNTVVQLSAAPFPGEVLARFSRRVGKLMSSAQLWRTMMYRSGILDRSAVPEAEVDAYRELALGTDQGAAYLQIMRGLHVAREQPIDFGPVLDHRRTPYPVQVLWGAQDPILSVKRFGWAALRATGLPTMAVVPARHFLQEDQAPAIAGFVAPFAHRASA